ncbi:sensor histidine kinase [Streptomyces sp. NPDC088910]|uniref:sensor histidine kinase n=1 Tax=Streptomyces sp. NPDC088910 TaxID=3365911 RepID=UPI0037F5E86C
MTAGTTGTTTGPTGTAGLASVQSWVEWLGHRHGTDRYRRYTLNSLSCFALFEAGLWTLWVVTNDVGPLWIAVAVLGAAHVVVQALLSRAGLRAYIGLAPRPYLLAALYTAVTVAAVAVGCVLQAKDRVEGKDLAPYVLWLMMFYAGPPMLALSLRAGTALVSAVTLGSLVAVFATGLRGESLAVVVGGTLFLVPFMALALRASGWSVLLIEELAAARGTQARLAVAEERLRFGRDLHDILGRNLAVVALKSELAAKLAERGSPEAVDLMYEVQRIAQDSQREIRSVVRGYRTADLHTELAGAREVLKAAGIPCRISDGPAARLPDDIQTALGWVIREAVTNVLRHAQHATRCEVSLRDTGEGAVTLVVENDGSDHRGGRGHRAGSAGGGHGPATTVGSRTADAASADGTTPGGSGLAGLEERLTQLQGTLTTSERSAGVFRLTVTIPWEETP